jgi:hypothetical protein
MPRLVAIAAILFLAGSMPLAAQHGGGHGSAGGHGGFAAHGSFGGQSSVGHSLSGAHSASGFAPRSYARGSFRSSRGLTSRNFGDFRGQRFRNYGIRNNCYGYRCAWGYGYPWLYGGIDPYWWGGSDSSYDQDQQYQIGLANEMNAQSLDEQRMREQADQYSYTPYASSSYAPSSPRSTEPRPSDPRAAGKPEAVPPTVLVFRDQHKLEVQNYAIVGQTLWNFAPQHTQKIPLSDLDLPATTKANEDRGVSFRVPGANEGQ